MALLRTAGKVATSWAVFILSAGWLALFSQTDMAARWHGHFMPANGPITITSIEPAVVRGAPGSRIRGYAEKFREECDYISVSWRLVDGDRSVTIPAFFTDEPMIRGKGIQEWEGLMVGITPDRISLTEGDAHHQCGSFPVTTPFFRPDELIVTEAAGVTAECESGAYSTSTGPGTCSGHGGVMRWLNEY